MATRDMEKLPGAHVGSGQLATQQHDTCISRAMMRGILLERVAVLTNSEKTHNFHPQSRHRGHK